jgi:streptogrisin C
MIFSFTRHITWGLDRAVSMRAILFFLLLALSGAVAAQRVQTQTEALTDDAIQYSGQFGVTPAEALRRLRAQQASAAITDAIAQEFASRLAGISIEHVPEYRIVVLLTGSEPVADRSTAGVPIIFRSGAKATHAEAVAALRKHLIDFRTDLPGARGAGYDQRTGEVVLLVTRADAERLGVDAIKAKAEQIGGVPVRVVINGLLESNLSVEGGGRVEGVKESGRRSMCTTGFAVTDGTQTGIATAAHCPDELTYYGIDGTTTSLPFVGQWGLAYQDVQINLSDQAEEPVFFSNRGAGSLRRLVSWRNAASTRAGEFVCHYGESSGYSCATVELTDYAPPGNLCGGPCFPNWITVKGPNCIPGDSGGPVFSGGVAYGIAKGVNRTAGGQCLFYHYMSTDYLPSPWRLLVSGPTQPRPGRPASD